MNDKTNKKDKYYIYILYLAIVWLLIFSFFTNTQILYADEIDTKEQELTEIQRMIQEQRANAKKLEYEKTKALKNKQKTQKELSQTQTKIKQLNITENNLKKSLDLSKNLLNQTNEVISDNQSLCNKTLLYLLLSDQAQTKLKQDSNDAYQLKLILQNIINEINKLETKKSLISQEKTRKEQEINHTLNITHTERNKLNNFSKTIKKLDTDISKFEKQRKKYLEKSKELERDALALQDLIDFLKQQAMRYKESFDFTGEYQWPLDGKILRHFGPHRHEKYDILTISNGVDIEAPLDKDIQAFADGEVVFSDWFTGAGKMIIIDHKNGFHTVYSYNNTLLVSKGDTIKKGQTIAKAGKTGSVTEPCLHFEIRRSGVPVNPMQFKN
jgi:murein DD-endopeptidase MepM/ murein hydrolase activator NlpD